MKFHQRLAPACALCVVACAQIAGFEQLSSHKPDANGGTSSTAGTAGARTSSAGAFAGSDSVAASAGESAAAGTLNGSGGAGHVAHAGNAPTAGSVGTSAGTGGATGGTTATMAGNAGITGSTAGSTGSSAGTTGSAGAAGAPVVGGCNAQLLRNADFDAGPQDFRMEATAPGILDLTDVITKDTNQNLLAANVAPRSGHYLAWIGGVLDSDKGSRISLMQDVLIPAKVSKLVLSGYLQIKTTEPDPKETSDQLDLTLQDTQMYWSFHFWKGTDVTNGWQAFSYEMSDAARLNALRGRTLTFYAEAIADTSEITSYWLDSLSLFAECPH